jgi:hypothetical protein
MVLLIIWRTRRFGKEDSETGRLVSECRGMGDRWWTGRWSPSALDPLVRYWERQPAQCDADALVRCPDSRKAQMRRESGAIGPWTASPRDGGLYSRWVTTTTTRYLLGHS